jgi:nucleoid-associated protein YgaU
MRSGKKKDAYKKPGGHMPTGKAPAKPVANRPVAKPRVTPAPAKAKVAPGMPVRKPVPVPGKQEGLESRLMAARAAAAARAAEQAKAVVKIIAEHTVGKDETLSHISLKYYKSAAKPYYMVIYEANKGTIGGNPNIIKPGMKLKIPELPAELKK